MTKDEQYSFLAKEVEEEKKERSTWGKIGMNALYVVGTLLIFLVTVFVLYAIFQGGVLPFVLTIIITGAIGKALRNQMFG